MRILGIDVRAVSMSCGAALMGLICGCPGATGGGGGNRNAGNANGTANANGNENANANGSASMNGNANANANSNSNANSSTPNANESVNENANANGNQNLNANSNVNENLNASMGDAAMGQAIVLAQCAQCHAADGSGGIGPNIQGDQLADLNARFANLAVHNGQRLTAQGILDVNAYLLTLP